MVKSYSFDESPERGPLTKLKASKTKKDIEQLLNSQQKQKIIFESPEAIKEQPREERDEESSRYSEKPKSAPQLPKVMPMSERRKIRL
jgi:hypothetical protein